MIKAILTDIEGTTSSIAFVKDVLFPYAAERLPKWLEKNRENTDVQSQITAVADISDCNADDLQSITRQLLDWIEQDVKATPLKALQGLLWESGYRAGDYRAHVYDDAVKRLHQWHDAGIPLYVYSSGSIRAQQLFFEHSEYGDLRPLFSGYFDTTTGAKSDAESYLRIATEIDLPAGDILFLTDSCTEIDAALEAGMRATLLVRPQDSNVNPYDVYYLVARTFHEVQTATD